MLYAVIIFAIMAVSFIVQEFIPVVEWAYHARLLLVHTVFLCAAITVPYPVMLGLALFAGFGWDAINYVPTSQGGELNFGFTILQFGLLGSFIQGIRPLFHRGRWELPVLMVGLCIFLGLLLEHLIISFQRSELVFVGGIWFKILANSLFAMLVSPFLLWVFSWLAQRSGYRIRMEGITRRFTYGNEI